MLSQFLVGGGRGRDHRHDGCVRFRGASSCDNCLVKFGESLSWRCALCCSSCDRRGQSLAPKGIGTPSGFGGNESDRLIFSRQSKTHRRAVDGLRSVLSVLSVCACVV